MYIFYVTDPLRFYYKYRFTLFILVVLYNIHLCILYVLYIWFTYNSEASRGAAAQIVIVKLTGYGFDPHSGRWNIYLNLYFNFLALVSRLSAGLSSATQHAMPPEFGRKWGTECLNTRFPLPTLLCAGYSVKLKKKKVAKLEERRTREQENQDN